MIRKLLTLALIAQISVAQADECEVEGLYPTTLNSLKGLRTGGFVWASSTAQSPPIDFNSLQDDGSKDGCKQGLTTGDRPNYPVSLIHNALPTDHAWTIRALELPQQGYADSNGYPYWSLQLSDAGNTRLGVLTATVFPGLQKLVVSLTIQSAASDGPVVTTVAFPYATAPLCADLSFYLGSPGWTTRNVSVVAGCPGNSVAGGSSIFKMPASLVPRTVRVGKLSADPGPNGTLMFKVMRDTNSSQP